MRMKELCGSMFARLYYWETDKLNPTHDGFGPRWFPKRFEAWSILHEWRSFSARSLFIHRWYSLSNQPWCRIILGVILFEMVFLRIKRLGIIGLWRMYLKPCLESRGSSSFPLRVQKLLFLSFWIYVDYTIHCRRHNSVSSIWWFFFHFLALIPLFIWITINNYIFSNQFRRGYVSKMAIYLVFQKSFFFHTFYSSIVAFDCKKVSRSLFLV